MKDPKRPKTDETKEAPAPEWEPYTGMDGEEHQEDPETW